MRRTYSRERYLALVERIREAIPDIALTTDIIVGFPGETEADFAETLSLVDEVGYDHAFTFVYSPRRGTEAAADARPGARGRQARADPAARRASSSTTPPPQRCARRHGAGGALRGPEPHRPEHLRGRTRGEQDGHLHAAGAAAGRSSTSASIGRRRRRSRHRQVAVPSRREAVTGRRALRPDGLGQERRRARARRAGRRRDRLVRRDAALPRPSDPDEPADRRTSSRACRTISSAIWPPSAEGDVAQYADARPRGDRRHHSPRRALRSSSAAAGSTCAPP